LLVASASCGGRPAASSEGTVRSPPPPAIASTTPAANAASVRSASTWSETEVTACGSAQRAVDGGTADETVTFALDGVSYEIDLTTEHAAELRDALAHWVANARKTSGRPAGRAARGARNTGRSSDATKIREWARANGHNVPERGRISADIRSAYEAAN